MDNIKRSLYAIRAKSSFEKSLLKATYDGDFDPPKEKHVQTVLWSLQGKSDKYTPDQSLNLTIQRLNTGKWVSILKCLMILHRGIEVVGSNFPQKLSTLNLLLSSFNDPTEKGSAHNKIIQDYYSYIKLKALSFSRKESMMNVEDSEKARVIGKLRNTEVIKELGQLVNQLEALVKLGPCCHQALKNYSLRLTQNCVFLILKDSASLYKATSLLVDRVVDIFNMLEKSHAEIAVELYQKFETCSRMIEQFFKMSEVLPYSGLTAPVIVSRSKNTLLSMKEYIRDSSGKKPRPHEGEGDEEQGGDYGNSDLGIELSPQELEAQRKLLEQFERDHKKKLEEERNSSLISEPIPPPSSIINQPVPGTGYPQAMQEPNKVDLIMGAFNQAPGGQGNNPNLMTGGMMNPYMTGMMGMNPMMTGMMNPMMMNPMMTGMMNPYMTGMMGMNPMMTGMNPMMAGMGTAPVKSNLDPLSQPIGSAVPDNKRNPFASKHSNQGPGGSSSNFVPGGNNLDNLFSTPAPSVSRPNNNPFEAPSKPSSTPSSKDPFSDLI